MGIAGLRQSNILGRIPITVFKGSRRQERTNRDGKKYLIQGADYADGTLRITTTDPAAIAILKRHYGQPDINGDFLVKSINIYLVYNEIEKTFSTSMQKWTASGLELVCDRQTITQEMQQDRDHKGNVCRNLVPADKPCPVANKHLGYKCPHECVGVGILYFHIREIFDEGLIRFCKLTTHSYEDLAYLGDESGGELLRIQEKLGAISLSPFPAYAYKHYIPLILSRIQVNISRPVLDSDKLRTGKKAQGTISALYLQVFSQYLILWEAWKYYQDCQDHQIALPQQVIAGLLRGDATAIEVIDAEVVETTVKQLPAALVDPLVDPIEAICDKWQTHGDAIAWAIDMLPNFSGDEIRKEFKKIPMECDRKVAWVKRVLELQMEVEF